MKIVLTGATGQVGKVLMRHLALSGKDITVDGTRREITNKVVLPDSDVIIHSAGLKFGWKSVQDPAPYIKTNIVGTFNMLESAVHNPPLMKFVLISTVEAADPKTPYAASKAAAEALALSYFHSYGLPVIVLRIPTVLSFSAEGEGFVAKLLRGEDVKINNNTKEWITEIDLAKDVLRHILAGKPGNLYTLSGVVLSDQEIAELCQAQKASL